MRVFRLPSARAALRLTGLVCVLAVVLATAYAGPRKVVATVARAPGQFLRTARHTLKFDLAPAVTVGVGEAAATGTITPPRRAAAPGPLRVDPAHPRYFSDGAGAPVYLTGSHTWSNLQDNGGSDPPPVFSYTLYLDFLQANNHNFFRLWAWEQSRWTLETADDQYWFDPMPYQRTGPGAALDGKAKFDLTKLNQAYFDRMRQRIIAAGERGMYVAVVLFNGWSVAKEKGGFAQNNPWRGHPFHADNNVNGVNGDPNGDNSGEEVHELGIPQITALQEAYVHKLIDTVHDLDNVLYEISNESHAGSKAWQYHMIEVIKSYEAHKPQQHPVGMTATYPGGSNADLFAGPADWISINNGDGALTDPPEADGSKVLLTDTDHLCGICGDRAWVWKSFTRGHNPIFMDGYDGAGYGVGGSGFNFDDPTWVSLRRSLGYTLAYAGRMNLALVAPRGDLASTDYCLANPAATGAEYLIYLPSGGAATVDLSAVTGELSVEWLNPATGETIGGTTVSGGGNRSFPAPFAGDAVLYLYQAQTAEQDTSYLPVLVTR